MQNFFKGVIITFILEILQGITSFFISVYRRQIFTLFRGLTFVGMGILCILLLAFLSTARPPAPVTVVLIIFTYVIFKWLRKANQILSFELEMMKSGEK